MNKLNVAIVVESLHLHGGVERRTSELVKGLLSSGHEVHVYANRWDPRAAEGATFHRIPMLKLDRVIKPLSFAWFCSALIPRAKHSLVHTQARIFRYDISTLGVGCHRGYLDALGIDPETSAERRFHKAILRIERSMFKPGNYVRILCNSAMVKGEIINYYNVPEDRVAVVYNGVDSDLFSPERRSELRDSARRELGLSPDELAVIYAGNGFTRKGLDTLVEAVGRSRYSGIMKILVVGRGKKEDYEKLAADCGIPGRLIWVGQSTDIMRHYAAADLFALPTRYDPFANSTMEALACGLPVITTRSNGVSEILNDGTDGFVIDRNDPDALSERIDVLAGDQELRQSMGSLGRALVEPFTWRRTAEETICAYGAVMQDRGVR